MQQTCRNPWCKASFEVTDDDLKFYAEVSPVFNGKKELIPSPTLCPDCRSQRRLSYRNERNLYRRTCDLTKASIISTYAPEKPFPVYESTAWYSDQWDCMDYGVPFDFSRPFFDQIRDLRNRVPRVALAVINNENCPYVNQVWNSKNCYLCIDGGFQEDALYCHATYHAKNITDCAFTREAEMSHDLLDCVQCYHCVSLIDCKNCSDSYFSIDCQQCKNVAFSWNLRGKQYCIFNKQMSKEEWERTTADMFSGSYRKMNEHRQKFIDLQKKALRRETHNILCEDCTGDYLQHSRSCSVCFDGDQCQDLKYCSRLDEKVVSSHDIDHGALLEVAYEALTVAGHNILFCHGSYSPTNSNMFCCDLFVSSSDCFGCVGIKNKKHCILNTQYSKEEYEKLVPRIIAHMRSAGEWGEFFPVANAPYAYNESVAQEPEYFPVTRAQAEKRGWKWHEGKEEALKADRTVVAADLPDSIDDIPDDILNWAVECEVTKRPFKIIKQELEFYRRMKLPVPHLHPDERHHQRIALRNPRKLWKRKCTKCGKGIETTYSPERLETIYCEKCYLKEVY